MKFTFASVAKDKKSVTAKYFLCTDAVIAYTFSKETTSSKIKPEKRVYNENTCICIALLRMLYFPFHLNHPLKEEKIYETISWWWCRLLWWWSCYEKGFLNVTSVNGFLAKVFFCKSSNHQFTMKLGNCRFVLKNTVSNPIILVLHSHFIIIKSAGCNRTEKWRISSTTVTFSSNQMGDVYTFINANARELIYVAHAICRFISCEHELFK